MGIWVRFVEKGVSKFVNGYMGEVCLKGISKFVNGFFVKKIT